MTTKRMLTNDELNLVCDALGTPQTAPSGAGRLAELLCDHVNALVAEDAPIGTASLPPRDQSGKFVSGAE